MIGFKSLVAIAGSRPGPCGYEPHVQSSTLPRNWHPVMVTLHALKIRSLLGIYYTRF